MKSFEEYKEGQSYSKEAQNAVRYGYQYRKEAEKYENGSSHACLNEASDILVWLANMIIGGAVWDVLKAAVNRLYGRLKKKRVQVDRNTETVLSDDEEFEVFCNYILEFHEHRLTINEEQIKYIRDEIVADYLGDEAEKIYDKEKRFPTIEEYKTIYREAEQLADELLGEEVK